MGIFDSLGHRGAQPMQQPAPARQAPQGQQITPQQALQQLRGNPLACTRQAHYNVPEGVGNDAESLVNYLMQSGQVSAPMQRMVAPLIRLMNSRR